MKNKPLFFKIITIITVFTVIFSVLCISSSAYTYDNTSAYNNNVKQFTLPETQIILQSLDYFASPDTDLPGYIYLPSSDYYARGERVVTAFNTSFGNRYVFKKNVVGSNVYENNGYVQESYIEFNNTFKFYDLYGFLIEEWWIDGNAIDSIYNSMTFTLENPNLLEQTLMVGNTIYWDNTIVSLPIRYYFEYIDLNGTQSVAEYSGRIIPNYIGNDDDGSFYEFNVRYLPSSLYTPYYDAFGSSVDLNGTYSIDLSNIAYIKTLSIFVGEDAGSGYIWGGGFFYENGATSGWVNGHYVNRLNLPNYSGDTFDTILDNVGDTYYDDGYDAGVDAGYDDGYDVGYDSGYDVGNSAGYDSGYDDGYIAGIAEGGSGTLNPFDSIISAVGSFLDWEFIDGISMAGLLSVVLGVCLVITFLKFFAGG